ncbi:hypothetical protein J6TS7_02870 [Paenibacillus dendritiformis]|uniref:hypothetical protein n=1 Tax=Paenibacillus TaxID=44249 RepID=UPI001B1605DB|nr:hypothetical protein [Paenibacillus dendritiformis]GIO76677.1 hypothetical protein J6TS7_02870 [Paenibacillus dendritiformis]
MLEIYRFLPPAVLKGKEVGDMDMDEFIRALSQSRVIQELEEDILARAIAKVLGE